MPQRVIMLEIGLVSAVRFYKFEDFLKYTKKKRFFKYLTIKNYEIGTTLQPVFISRKL